VRIVCEENWHRAEPLFSWHSARLGEGAEAHTLSSITRAFLILILIALPLFADDGATAPNFFIEKIEVRDANRVSADVVVAESRLREGQEYSEAELRDASARLMRLPFLLSAEFSLEKGSERGRYVLVVTINETKPFFYALDLRPIFTTDHRVEPDYSDRIGVADSAATLGMRWFVGRRGALHIALISSDYGGDFARDYAAVAVGYTQYDLFGTRAFATLNLKRVITEGDSGVSPQLVVGVPLTGNQTLTLELDETRFGDTVQYVGSEPFDRSRGQRIVGVTWSYNTTNKPFLPTRGTLLTVRPRFSWSDSATYRFIVIDPTQNPPVFEVRGDTVHSEAREVTVKAVRYFELDDRNSVSAGIEGALTHFRTESAVTGLHGDHVTRAVIVGGYSYSLWDAARTRNGDSRLELNLRIGTRDIQYADFYRAEQQQLTASWVRRSSWGVLRLGAGYAW
jgi:hypothetical protein